MRLLFKASNLKMRGARRLGVMQECRRLSRQATVRLLEAARDGKALRVRRLQDDSTPPALASYEITKTQRSLRLPSVNAQYSEPRGPEQTA